MAKVFNFDVYLSPFLYGGVTASTIRIFDRNLWLLNESSVISRNCHFHSNTLRYKKLCSMNIQLNMPNYNERLESLISINEVLTPNIVAGIRDCDSFVRMHGGDRYFVSHLEVEKHLQDWFYDLEVVRNIDDAINLLIKFNDIHPFRDGNGRTLRFLTERYLQYFEIDSINPHLYFLMGYEGQIKKNNICPYSFSRSIEWGRQKFAEVNSVIEIYNQQIRKEKFLLCDSSVFFLKEHSLSKPFFSATDVSNNVDVFEFLMSNKEVIKLYSKRYGVVYYAFSRAVECLSSIDKIIFNRESYEI